METAFWGGSLFKRYIGGRCPSLGNVVSIRQLCDSQYSRWAAHADLNTTGILQTISCNEAKTLLKKAKSAA